LHVHGLFILTILGLADPRCFTLFQVSILVVLGDRPLSGGQIGRLGDVTEAAEVEVDLRNPLLETLDEGRELAQAVLVGFAALDTSERDNAVIDDETHVSGIGGVALGVSRTREDLADHVGAEWCELGNNVALLLGDVVGGKGTAGSKGREVHGHENYQGCRMTVRTERR
jgi:hypothetical protein